VTLYLNAAKTGQKVFAYFLRFYGFSRNLTIRSVYNLHNIVRWYFKEYTELREFSYY